MIHSGDKVDWRSRLVALAGVPKSPIGHPRRGRRSDLRCSQQHRRLRSPGSAASSAAALSGVQGPQPRCTGLPAFVALLPEEEGGLPPPPRSAAAAAALPGPVVVALEQGLLQLAAERIERPLQRKGERERGHPASNEQKGREHEKRTWKQSFAAAMAGKIGSLSVCR